ncbi:unnamed protein product [Nippostrongylus brasiliensis]|uniref:C2H2-type domain-containing protein n=1 Tax=Nippostrongylus brasiliensis TaxID=27835 RepID=A0A0N4XJI0_NIPBR|nr:unnamed protein product [Nippostrongylus brasiliensis]
MKTHMIGHQKRFGFQCPFCTFKSESAGFLKRHVEIHGSRSYAWPPVYVGVNPRKTAPEPVGKKAQCRSTMKVLFLRCASQHTPSGSSMRWPCPMNNCKFSAAVVPQHVTHHIRRHVNYLLISFLVVLLPLWEWGEISSLTPALMPKMWSVSAEQRSAADPPNHPSYPAPPPEGHSVFYA